MDGLPQDLGPCTRESDYRLSETGPRARKRQEQAEHASMGNALMNRQTFFTSSLDRKYKSADVEQLADICSSWEIRAREIRRPLYAAGLYT